MAQCAAYPTTFTTTILVSVVTTFWDADDHSNQSAFFVSHFVSLYATLCATNFTTKYTT